MQQVQGKRGAISAKGKPMLVRCGRCGIELDEIASLCHACGARLVTVGGSWYWQKGPKTGIQKHFEEDENGKREDLYGDVE